MKVWANRKYNFIKIIVAVSVLILLSLATKSSLALTISDLFKAEPIEEIIVRIKENNENEYVDVEEEKSEIMAMAGAGTSTNPYIITTIDQLKESATTGKYYALGNDLDFSGNLAWLAIDYKSYLDGRNYTIKNLTVNNSGLANVGLFATLYGTVSNLNFSNAMVTGGKGNTGILCGTCNKTISNVYVLSGTVSGGINVGGIVGETTLGTITNCGSSANVSGATTAGGIVGNAIDGKISKCYSTGSVNSSNKRPGGIVGMAYRTS